MSGRGRLFAAPSHPVPPLRAALPIRKDPPGATEAVLLLHGFTGHPGELSIQAEAIAAAGYAVLAPRYPGHGTCRADFLATRAEDWARRALDAYLELRAEYGRVHLLGHSMGGLLATLVAARKAEEDEREPARLILFAPAFALSRRAFALAPLVARFAPVIRHGRPVPEGEAGDPDRVTLHREYRSDDLVVMAAELEWLRRRACRLLPGVRSHILVVVGERDETVPPEVARFVATRAQAAASIETRMLPGAGHVFPFDRDGATAAAFAVDFLGPGPRR